MTKIKSIGEVLALLGEHIEALRPCNKPDYNTVTAAKNCAAVVSAYLEAVMVSMEYAEKIGETPNFEFMEIGNGEIKEERPGQPATLPPEGSSAGRKRGAVAR